MGMLIGSMVFVLRVSFDADLGGDVFATTVKKNFDRVVKTVTDLPLLRPTIVSVYQRAGGGNRLGLRDLDDDSNLYDVDTYDERLLVVKPNNWFIYTNDGINFHYLVNDVDKSRSVCANTDHLNAVRYSLRPIGDAKRYTSIKYSCVEYTMDSLIRVFAVTGDRTDLDLTDYFDARENVDAPLFTVENVLEFLVVNSYV